jgi:Tfp pilus assembly protein PilO
MTNISDRDRKILMAIVPLVVLLAYWFLLFSPKREAATTAAAELSVQEERRDAARAVVDQANASKTDFAADYGEIVRLGKAIPAQVDMPSLLLQLDGAAKGTGIRFTRIAAGERSAPELPPAASAGSEPPSGSGSEPPVAAGGDSAASAPGGATEAANNAAATGNQQAAAASGVDPADAQTSTSTREGGLPVGGGTATGAAAPTAPAGLETVPLELEFTGDFFNLADFFHRVKRFVHVVNNNVVVNGRLVTIEGVNYSSDSALFPKMKAELTATVYLTPKAQGVTAGATPQGPGVTTTPAAEGTPAPSSTPSPAPTAVATP